MKKKGKLKKAIKFITDVISWTCLCILILIGICIVWYVIAAKIYASKGEEYKPYFSLYTIISPSMEPHIRVYDVILDTRVDDTDKIKVGDVITFVSTGSLSNGMVITHRVIDIIETNDGKRFVTKGDNNQTADGATVIPSNVLGKTLLRFPQLGRVQFLLANKGAYIILILIPALGVIVYDFVKLFRNSKLKTKVENAISSGNDNNNDVDKEAQKLLEEQRKKELKEKLNQDVKDENSNSSQDIDEDNDY